MTEAFRISSVRHSLNWGQSYEPGLIGQTKLSSIGSALRKIAVAWLTRDALMDCVDHLDFGAFLPSSLCEEGPDALPCAPKIASLELHSIFDQCHWNARHDST